MTLSQLFLNQESDLQSIENMEVLRAGSGRKYYRTLFLTTAFTAKNAVISPNFLVQEFCGKTQFLHENDTIFLLKTFKNLVKSQKQRIHTSHPKEND